MTKRSNKLAYETRVAGHLSTTPSWRIPAKCLSQRHHKLTCQLVPHTVPLVVISNVKDVGLTLLGIQRESTASEADALTTGPSESNGT